ncbi:MAG: non-canonical purine NTP pyrophosphatase [Acidobacteria bacterium]|nr:non-canonical purine NTP pyrophosphatase [Acidobacteriota bacterium]
MDRYELLIATRNPGKIEELREAFAILPLRLRTLNEFGNISEVLEVGATYEENATLKAIGYSRQTGITALADDSGLEVDALQGGPGVLSARFRGNNLLDAERTQSLLATLQDVGPPRRTARFVCCMVLYGPVPSSHRMSERKVLAVTQGVCSGSLAMKPKGTEGFGFDPIFIPEGYNVPFASLDPAIKRKISHRARAAALMRQRMEQQFTSNLTAGRTAS